MSTSNRSHARKTAPEKRRSARPRWLRPSIFLSLMLVSASLATAGCTGPATRTQSELDTMIGRPPPPGEDPFFIQAIPADAIAVDPSGNIGVDIHNPAPQPQPPGATARAEIARLEAQIQKLEAEKTRLESARAQTARLQAQLEEAQRDKSQLAAQLDAAQQRAEAAQREIESARQQPKDGQTAPLPPTTPQCFSCVRICPTARGCDNTDEDVICGWGTHADAAQARQVARAQCDATLDLARQMPVWSRIDGQCPPATCR